MMLLTAYAQRNIPVVAQELGRLGFPAHHFRVELCVAKVLGVLALLLPRSIVAQGMGVCGVRHRSDLCPDRPSRGR